MLSQANRERRKREERFSKSQLKTFINVDLKTKKKFNLVSQSSKNADLTKGN